MCNFVYDKEQRIRRVNWHELMKNVVKRWIRIYFKEVGILDRIPNVGHKARKKQCKIHNNLKHKSYTKLSHISLEFWISYIELQCLIYISKLTWCLKRINSYKRCCNVLDFLTKSFLSVRDVGVSIWSPIMNNDDRYYWTPWDLWALVEFVAYIIMLVDVIFLIIHVLSVYFFTKQIFGVQNWDGENMQWFRKSKCDQWW